MSVITLSHIFMRPSSMLVVSLALLCICAPLRAIASAPDGPWSQFIYAPSSRTVYPQSIKVASGSVEDAHNLVLPQGDSSHPLGSATLSGNQTWVALDFGVEVGGLVSMHIDSASSSSGLALSFTESPMFISPLTSDDSSYPSPNMSYDGVLHLESPLQRGPWTQPVVNLRGGFRYLTIVSTNTGSTAISNVSVAISFMPHKDDLRDYSGFFYSQDPVFHDADFLTKIWYAGAYTVQTNTVPVNTGRQVPFVSSPGWENNATLGVAGPIIVDGAKRDRAVWPGDMGVAVPTQFVSTNDLLPTRNALSTLFAAINPVTGALPESGPPLSQQGSDTYHMWTLIGTHNYFLYSGDTEWLSTVWSNYTKAVQFVLNKVDSTGLMNVTGLRDWARLGGGGHNAEGNALLYKVLVDSADLATHVNATDLAQTWNLNATALKTRYNQYFWLESAGMYRDNDTTTLCPQDANSMAVLYNVTTSTAQANSISRGLERNWNDLGPVAPELPGTISPFISSLELQAHFASGNDARAMDLLRREWGYILYTNLSVQSTILEGFTANGSLDYRSYDGYNYDASYTSHAHGWSTGPTSALTFYVLGLTITSPQGKTWSIVPHTAGLPFAEGGIETPLGQYRVQWSLSSGPNKKFTISIQTPPGTSGTIQLPFVGETMLNNEAFIVPDNGTLLSLEGGNHSVVVS